MTEKRWREFVEDDKGVGSSVRLCMVFGTFVGGIIVLWMTYLETITWEFYASFLAASGGVYGWGKYRESVERVEQTRADSPATTKDVNIKAEGDINVSGN